MKKFTKLEIFELITILILFVALIADNGVIKYEDVKEEPSTYLSNKKDYVAKYIDNDITGCDLSDAVSSLTDISDSNNLFLKMYPVGSIYTSIDSANPATKFGGTWVSFGTGRTLVGVDVTQTEFDTVEETGGEKTHILTVSEMPSHTHNLKYWIFNGGSAAGVGYKYGLPYQHDTGELYNSSTSGQIIHYAENTGGGSAHNNLQPYVTVYMWKRTA